LFLFFNKATHHEKIAHNVYSEILTVLDGCFFMAWSLQGKTVDNVNASETQCVLSGSDLIHLKSYKIGKNHTREKFMFPMRRTADKMLKILCIKKENQCTK